MSSASRSRVEELAGQVLAVGLPDPILEASTRVRLRALNPSGCILFARNVVTAAQVGALCDDLRELLVEPLLVIDQEGGRVDRLRAWRGSTRHPREVASLGAAEVAAEAESVASTLSALGLNFNCAPVVDLDEGRDANGIGDRSLGSDPVLVATLASEVIDAHSRHGIATCLKHFPGLGRTGADTHLARPAIEATRAEIEEREIAPFRLLRDRCPAIMVCHASVPALTGDDTPASLSREVVHGLLRKEMGFDGLIVSDDLAMGAVADRSAATQAVEAISAGCDLLLYCQPSLDAAEQAWAALVVEAERGTAFLARLEDAAGRVRAFRRALARGGV